MVDFVYYDEVILQNSEFFVI